MHLLRMFCNLKIPKTSNIKTLQNFAYKGTRHLNRKWGSFVLKSGSGVQGFLLGVQKILPIRLSGLSL